MPALRIRGLTATVAAASSAGCSANVARRTSTASSTPSCRASARRGVNGESVTITRRVGPAHAARRASSMRFTLIGARLPVKMTV
jgi:hypothetical protein